MKRMTVSLPDELVDRIKRAAGGERQVSAYVAAALQEYQEREKLDGILADWQAETPVPDEVRRPRRAVAQAWRSPRQARLARLLKSSDIDIAVMTVNVAGAVGLMRAAAGHDDVVDVHVVVCARQGHHAIVTSDPRDIARMMPPSLGSWSSSRTSLGSGGLSRWRAWSGGLPAGAGPSRDSPAKSRTQIRGGGLT
jgi:hypothetical protein